MYISGCRSMTRLFGATSGWAMPDSNVKQEPDHIGVSWGFHKWGYLKIDGFYFENPSIHG